MSSGRPRGEVVADRRTCSPADRRHAFLRALAQHPDETVVEIEVTDIETHELADA